MIEIFILMIYHDILFVMDGSGHNLPAGCHVTNPRSIRIRSTLGAYYAMLWILVD